MSERLIAGIEVGGTKIVPGIGTADGRSVVPTGRIKVREDDGTGRDPEIVMAELADWFAQASKGHDIAAVGVASFGPLDLDPRSGEYGHILPSAKVAWSNFDLLGRCRAMLSGVPGAIDTDVNTAALAEARLGAGREGGDLAYVTVGTGIGIGYVVNGRTVHGASHPETGHVLLRRHPAHEGFKGVCAFHGDCVEGLASGPAVVAAWGDSLDHLPSDHPAWDVEAFYLGHLAAMLILAVSPDRLVFGGGVMSQQALFAPLRDHAARALAGYGRFTDRAALDRRIVPPGCQEPPGLVGAYLIGAGAAG